MITLGIETSCDETALALIETADDGRIRPIHSLVHSQAELHSAYGGVYPSLAKREHSKNLVPLLHKLMIEAGAALRQQTLVPSWKASLESCRAHMGAQNPELFEALMAADFLGSKPPIDRIAVTEGPGLEPALWVGIIFARALSEIWNIPIIPVDHMEGHIVGSLLPHDLPFGSWLSLPEVRFPAVVLLVSGGHTELVRMEAIGSYEIIGHTRDDAAGEAFDKAARLLDLPYPGGPHLSRLAHEAREQDIAAPVDLPRPMLGSGDLDFSFSGLKTAVLYAVRDAASGGPLTDGFKRGLAREFEDAVVDVLDRKVCAAIDRTTAGALIVGGGVAANATLRERLSATAQNYGIPLHLPSAHVSGDNALMIALAGTLQTLRDPSSAHTKTPGEIRAFGTKKLGRT